MKLVFRVFTGMRPAVVYGLMAVALLENVNVNAQTDRGGYLVGGNADISYDFNGTNRNFNFSVAPSFAVFVVKNFAMGANYAITIGIFRHLYLYNLASNIYRALFKIL
jgi:hypothetical protein